MGADIKRGRIWIYGSGGGKMKIDDKILKIEIFTKDGEINPEWLKIVDELQNTVRSEGQS